MGVGAARRRGPKLPLPLRRRKRRRQWALAVQRVLGEALSRVATWRDSLHTQRLLLALANDLNGQRLRVELHVAPGRDDADFRLVGGASFIELTSQDRDRATRVGVPYGTR